MSRISKLLESLGIEHKEYQYHPKSTTESSVGILMILKKEARIGFLDRIGFWHGKKTKRLSNSLNL